MMKITVCQGPLARIVNPNLQTMNVFASQHLLFYVNNFLASVPAPICLMLVNVLRGRIIHGD